MLGSGTRFTVGTRGTHSSCRTPKRCNENCTNARALTAHCERAISFGYHAHSARGSLGCTHSLRGHAQCARRGHAILLMASPPGVGERVRHYLSGADLDQPRPADEGPLARLPQPLPISVRRVATAQLLALGTLVAIVVVAIAVGALAIVIMPIALGRQGVGMAMVSLFGVCTSALLTTLPFFAARGAARIIRRDARGIAPVMRVAWLTVLLAIPLGFAGALGLNFISPNNAAQDGLSLQSRAFLVLLALFVVLALWTLAVLRRYKRSLPPEML